MIVAAGAFFVARQGGVSTALSFNNEVRGSGVAAAQRRTVPSFRAIDLTGSSSIRVHVGPRQTVVINADDNLIDRVTTDVRDGVLVVSESGSFSTNLPLRVDVTVPTLAAVGLRGSGTINVAGVTARTFSAELSGSGSSRSQAQPINSMPPWPDQETCSLASSLPAPPQPQFPGQDASRFEPPTRSRRR